MNGTGLRLRLTDQAARALGLKRRMPATNEGDQLARELRYALLTQAKLRSPERTRSFTKAGPGRMHGGKVKPTGSKLWRKCPSAFETEEVGA